MIGDVAIDDHKLLVNLVSEFDTDLMSAAAGSALLRSRHSMMTLAPRLARSAAVILPMPVLAPVITATFPSRLLELRHRPPCVLTNQRLVFMSSDLSRPIRG